MQEIGYQIQGEERVKGTGLAATHRTMGDTWADDQNKQNTYFLAKMGSQQADGNVKGVTPVYNQKGAGNPHLQSLLSLDGWKDQTVNKDVFSSGIRKDLLKV